MSKYQFPKIPSPAPIKAREILLAASGVFRQPGKRVSWPAQVKMEEKIITAFAKENFTVKRTHGYDPVLLHGFIHNQRMGMKIFKNIDKDPPLVIAEAVWQYSQHLLLGLLDHRGPILTIANWSGE